MGNNPVIDPSGASYNIIDLINLFIAVAVFIAIALSVYYIFVGGISFILSAGKEEKIKEAVNTIRYAVIGLVVTVLAVVFISVIGNIFGISISDKINAERMLQIGEKIYERVIEGPNSNSGGSSSGLDSF